MSRFGEHDRETDDFFPQSCTTLHRIRPSCDFSVARLCSSGSEIIQVHQNLLFDYFTMEKLFNDLESHDSTQEESAKREFADCFAACEFDWNFVFIEEENISENIFNLVRLTCETLGGNIHRNLACCLR